MAYSGYPLLGDDTYGKGENKFGVKGHMLHAMILGIIHPVSNKYMEFSTNPPFEFEEILKKLRNKEN